MQIPRIDLLLFGYRKISFNDKDVTSLLNIFLQAGISVKLYGNEFLISEKILPKIEKLLSGKIEYSVSEAKGLIGFFKNNRRRYGIFLGVLVSLFLCIFSNSRVWDIRIEGGALENEEEIIEELSELGFSVGTPWRKIDKSKLEKDMLATSENVSWINVNQRGNVAYISVIDKITHEKEEEKAGYANVVATRDAVIEEITVKSGTALVKAGETVKKGQILISGVIPSELGGGFCYAEGTVKGRYSDEISVEIRETGTLKEVKERRVSKISLKIFNFSFKIFEKYRKSEEECDIIKEKKSFNTFLGKKLPFFLERDWQLFYSASEIFYTKEEMVNLAASSMRDRLNLELKDKDLLKIKTSGKFSDGVYVLTSEYTILGNVGKALEFDVVK